MIFLIHVKHGRILRPCIAHVTGTPPVVATVNATLCLLLPQALLHGLIYCIGYCLYFWLFRHIVLDIVLYLKPDKIATA